MIRPRFIRRALASAGVLLAVSANPPPACAAAADSGSPRKGQAFEPQPATRPIDAGGAGILYSVRVSRPPDPRNAAGSADHLDAKDAAIERFVLSCLTNLALFTNAPSVVALDPALPPAEAAAARHAAAFELRANVQLWNRSQGPQTMYPVTIQIVDLGSGGVVKGYSGASRGERERALGAAIGQLAERLMDDFEGQDFRKMCAQALNPDPADLGSLLAWKDLSIAAGSAHNRALIAANTLTLPGILRGEKTPDLVALKVKVEQAIFDLTHNAEVAKERAESNIAAGQSDGDLREQSLIYTERVGILKPMLASLNDEIANRSK